MDSHFRIVILLQTDSETALVSMIKHHYGMHGWDNVVKTFILSLKAQLLSSEFYNICSFFLKAQLQLLTDEIRNSGTL